MKFFMFTAAVVLEIAWMYVFTYVPRESSSSAGCRHFKVRGYNGIAIDIDFDLLEELVVISAELKCGDRDRARELQRQIWERYIQSVHN